MRTAMMLAAASPGACVIAGKSAPIVMLMDTWSPGRHALHVMLQASCPKEKKSHSPMCHTACLNPPWHPSQWKGLPDARTARGDWDSAPNLMSRSGTRHAAHGLNLISRCAARGRQEEVSLACEKKDCISLSCCDVWNKKRQESHPIIIIQCTPTHSLIRIMISNVQHT